MISKLYDQNKDRSGMNTLNKVDLQKLFPNHSKVTWVIIFAILV